MKKIFYIAVILILSAHCKLIAQGNNAYPLEGVLWKAKNEGSSTIDISVCWDNATPQNAHYRALVEEAIHNSWEKYSSVRFTGWSTDVQTDADLHVYINDTVPNCKKLGTDLRHMQKGIVLNFDFNNWDIPCRQNREYCIKLMAIHEFGHALGFAHEQNRPDCHFENCLNKEQGQRGSWSITPCDPKSIMNYCNPTPYNNGQLSDSDIIAVQSLYGTNEDAANYIKPGLQVVYNCTLSYEEDGIKHYDASIYLSGSPKELVPVDRVIYYLDPLWFRNGIFCSREIYVDNKDSNYGIGLGIWGGVNIVAFVILKNGDEIVLPKLITP